MASEDIWNQDMDTLKSGLADRTPRFTIEQYLKIERAAVERHEFLDGVIYDMAGESLAHGRISVNLIGLLHAQLKGKNCQVLAKDMRTFSDRRPPNQKGSKGLFSYPDLVVVCGEPALLDEVKDVLLNPTAVIEVLSPSTEVFDRGDKFRKYQVNPSLKEYLLVSQKRPEIEIYRKNAGQWTYETVEGLDGVVVISSISCKLSMLDVYDRVEFSPDVLEYGDTPE